MTSKQVIEENIKKTKENLNLQYNSIKDKANNKSSGRSLLDTSYCILILETRLKIIQDQLRILEKEK